mgnify:FL=1
MLKSIKPEVIRASKPKIMISGPSGSGKTMFALEFPRPYMIDVEEGATREQYQEKLKRAGGAYFGKAQGAQDIDSVLAEFKELASTKHDYLTVIVDSYSKLYNIVAADAELRVGSDYGKDKREANKPSRQLLRWIDKIDLSVILICHAKDKWGGTGQNRSVVGTTFDGFEKFEYDLDLWLEVRCIGGVDRKYTVKKSRIDAFPAEQVYELDYSDFARRYGRNLIDGQPRQVVLATREQIDRVVYLVDLLKVPDADVQKWMTRSDSDSWEEMSSQDIDKIILFLEKRIGNGKSKEKK